MKEIYIIHNNGKFKVPILQRFEHNDKSYYVVWKSSLIEGELFQSSSTYWIVDLAGEFCKESLRFQSLENFKQQFINQN